MRERFFLMTATGVAGEVKETEFAYLVLTVEAQYFLHERARRAAEAGKGLRLRERTVKLPAGTAELYFLVSDRNELLASLMAGRAGEITLYNQEKIRAVRRIAPEVVEIEKPLSATAILSLTADEIFRDIYAIYLSGTIFHLAAEFLFLQRTGKTGALDACLLNEKESAVCAR